MNITVIPATILLVHTLEDFMVTPVVERMRAQPTAPVGTEAAVAVDTAGSRFAS
jgi:hypothetical protein